MNKDTPFAVHSLSKGLTGFEQRVSRTALAWAGLVLGLIACALPFALRLLLLLVRADSWPAYVLLCVVVLGLLALLTEVNYFGRAWYLTLLYAVSATALMFLSWNGHTADVLEARGTWTKVTVVQVTERPRRDTVCELQRTNDGTTVPRLLDNCADLSQGDTLSVLEDPEGEVRPQRSAPSTLGTYLAAGIAGSVLIASVTGAFWTGGRRRGLSAPPSYPPPAYPGPPAHPGQTDPYSGPPPQAPSAVHTVDSPDTRSRVARRRRLLGFGIGGGHGEHRGPHHR